MHQNNEKKEDLDESHTFDDSGSEDLFGEIAQADEDFAIAKPEM